MILKINRHCWLKYCQPGILSVPAPTIIPNYGNSLRASGNRVIVMLVSTMPVSVALRTVVLQTTEGTIDERRDLPVPELPQTANQPFLDRTELYFSLTENFLSSARLQAGWALCLGWTWPDADISIFLYSRRRVLGRSRNPKSWWQRHSSKRAMQDRCKVNIDRNRKENGITSDTSATTSNTSTPSPEISTPSCCRCLNRNYRIEESLAVMTRPLTCPYMRKPSMLTGARRRDTAS